MSADLANRVTEALRQLSSGHYGQPLGASVLADCWSEVRRLREDQAKLMAYVDSAKAVAERFGRVSGEPLARFILQLGADRDTLRAQLEAAKAALGEGWLADGASLALGITRKTRVLEGLEASAPVSQAAGPIVGRGR